MSDGRIHGCISMIPRCAYTRIHGATLGINKEMELLSSQHSVYFDKLNQIGRVVEVSEYWRYRDVKVDGVLDVAVTISGTLTKVNNANQVARSPTRRRYY